MSALEQKERARCQRRAQFHIRRALRRPTRRSETPRDRSRTTAPSIPPLPSRSDRRAHHRGSETRPSRYAKTRPRRSGNTLLFAKNRFLLEKESDQKHAPGQSPRPPPRPRRTTWWFKDDKLTTALPLALARFAKETRKWRPLYNLCGQNRVQLIISDSRDSSFFSWKKHTKKKQRV